jgi:hypothetical protein
MRHAIASALLGQHDAPFEISPYTPSTQPYIFCQRDLRGWKNKSEICNRPLPPLARGVDDAHLLRNVMHRSLPEPAHAVCTPAISS